MQVNGPVSPNSVFNMIFKPFNATLFSMFRVGGIEGNRIASGRPLAIQILGDFPPPHTSINLTETVLYTVEEPSSFLWTFSTAPFVSFLPRLSFIIGNGKSYGKTSECATPHKSQILSIFFANLIELEKKNPFPERAT